MRTGFITILASLTASACAAAEDPAVAQTGLVARDEARLVVDRTGGRVPAAPVGITRIGRTLWIGTRAVADYSTPEEKMRGELVRIDLDSGAARVFEDELPRIVDWDGEQPVWTAGAAAIGRRTFLASFQGLVEVADKITLQTFEVAPGVTAHANVIAADTRAGHELLWLGTDVGLLGVSPDTKKIVTRLDPATLGGEHVVSVSVAAATGAVYAVVHGEDGGTRVVRVVEGRVVSSWSPSDGGQVWNVIATARLGGALVAVRSFDAATGGVFVWHGGEGATRLVTEGELALAARGRSEPFGTSVMTYDEEHDLLVVGGQIRPGGLGGGLTGGGLAWVDLSSSTPRLSGISTWTSAIRGDHVTALAWDPVRRRTYAALRNPCNEFKLSNIGVETITFENGAPRFERSVLSGVRDIAVDGDTVRLSLRDEDATLVCFNVAIQEGIVELRSDGTGAVADHRDRRTPSFHSNRVAFGAMATAVGGRLVAAASREWGLFIGGPDGTLTNPFASFNMSKKLHDIVFDGDRTVWLAGAASHSLFDTPEMADRGPRGAVRVDLDAFGVIMSATRFVARITDREPGSIVPGLPSGDVRAVIPAGDGSVYLVCGTERYTDLPWDKVEGDPFVTRDGERLGGVARVEADGKTVTVLAAGDVVPDGRAGALGPDGTLYVLDAVHGLLQWDGTRFVSAELPTEAPRGSVPTALWIGRDGDMAASFSTGVSVRLGGVGGFLDGFGHAWRAAERAPGVLLIGTDEGLLRVRAPNARDVVETAPAAGELPPFSSK